MSFFTQFAFVYIFNLIIGVGALSLPKSFSDAGIVLGTILLVILAFMSYVTSTFMIEAMATANAYVRHKSRKKHSLVEAQSSQIQHSDKNDTDYVSCPLGHFKLSQCKLSQCPLCSPEIRPPGPLILRTLRLNGGSPL